MKILYSFIISKIYIHQSAFTQVKIKRSCLTVSHYVVLQSYTQRLCMNSIPKLLLCKCTQSSPTPNLKHDNFDSVIYIRI